MHCVRTVTDNLYWVGANDHRLTLFETSTPFPRGSATTPIFCWTRSPCCLTRWTGPPAGSCWRTCPTCWGKNMDYLVINHMEPDHGAMH